MGEISVLGGPDYMMSLSSSGESMNKARCSHCSWRSICFTLQEKEGYAYLVHTELPGSGSADFVSPWVLSLLSQ